MTPSENDESKTTQILKCTGATTDLHRTMAEGLLYTHTRLTINTRKTLEASSFLYALVELLEERGLITIEELDLRKVEVAERLTQQYRENGMGALFQEPEFDKYTFAEQVEIDCESRVHICRAACCRLPFALSKQDIREGIVHWDLGQPYLIAHNGNGSYSHLDPSRRSCSVWEHRPVPCRAFNCRQDQRIWLDFENKTINPEIERVDWPLSVAQKEDLEAEP